MFHKLLVIDLARRALQVLRKVVVQAAIQVPLYPTCLTINVYQIVELGTLILEDLPAHFVHPNVILAHQQVQVSVHSAQAILQAHICMHQMEHASQPVLLQLTLLEILNAWTV